MKNKKNTTEEIKKILGLEELTPMQSGEILGGVNKKIQGGKCGKPKDEIDVDIEE